MGRKKKPMPKGTRQGKPLSDSMKELIRQSFLITGSKRETARQLNLAERTVYKYIKEYSAETGDEDLIEARKKAAVEIAGKIHDRTLKIIDSISDEDLVSGRIPVKNKNGDIVGYNTYGPSLMQKVTAAAIFTDKLKVIREYESALRIDEQQGVLPAPSDIQGLVAGIKGKLKSLTVLNVKFQEDNPDLTQRILQKVEEAEVTVEPESNLITLEDFDNPDLP